MLPSTCNACTGFVSLIPILCVEEDKIKSPLLLISSVLPSWCFKTNCCGSPAAVSFSVDRITSWSAAKTITEPETPLVEVNLILPPLPNSNVSIGLAVPIPTFPLESIFKCVLSNPP